MIHLFYGLGGLIGYARTAFAQMGADIQSLLSPQRDGAEGGTG